MTPRATTSATRPIRPIDTSPKLAAALPYILIIGGIIGIICSVILMSDQIQIWKDPQFLPSCNLNPIVSCGTVINSKEGEIFGIPAPFFGLMVFPAILTVGVAMLAGATFKSWFWRLFEAGMVGSVLFALWLFWLSLYRVHAVCPFCLTVDVAVYTVAWYTTLYVIREQHILIPRRLLGLADFARMHHAEILVTWLLLITALILQHFWYYFGQFI